MKKKLIWIIPACLILIWTTIFIIDNIRIKDDKKPLITFKTRVDKYKDGEVREYYSLGYVGRIYKRDLVTKSKLNYIFVPQDYKYVSSGNINDVSKLFQDKTLGKYSFIKITGYISSDKDGIELSTYEDIIVIKEDMSAKSDVKFDNEVIFKCSSNKIINNSELEINEKDKITLLARVKKLIRIRTNGLLF